MRGRHSSGRLFLRLFGLWGVLTVAASTAAWAQSYTVLADFGAQAEGWSPKGSLLKASDGNFYGTTEQGGQGHGTIFRLTPGGAMTTVYRFWPTGGEGSTPTPDLIEAGGRLYGTTQGGGASYGTIFQFDPATSTLTTLHAFDYSQGAGPRSGLTLGGDGSFYGTTQSGGASGLGTLYRWTPGSTPAFTLLHSFGTLNPAGTAYIDGYWPIGGLVEYSPGVFYGAASVGGTGGGYGTLFKFTAATGVTEVHTFTSYDGYYPLGALTKGTDGKLYGQTAHGGAYSVGTIFAFDPAAATPFTLLHSFTGADGSYPAAPLTLAGDGTFYGTTVNGGSGYGVVFRYAPGAATPFTLLHSFNSTDGANPYGAVVEKTAGIFLGTTSANGSAGSAGTIWQLTTGGSPALATLYEFEGSPAAPSSALVQAADGSFYGSSLEGGTHAAGTLFRLDPAGVVTTLFNFGGTVRPITRPAIWCSTLRRECSMARPGPAASEAAPSTSSTSPPRP